MKSNNKLKSTLRVGFITSLAMLMPLSVYANDSLWDVDPWATEKEVVATTKPSQGNTDNKNVQKPEVKPTPAPTPKPTPTPTLNKPSNSIEPGREEAYEILHNEEAGMTYEEVDWDKIAEESHSSNNGQSITIENPSVQGKDETTNANIFDWDFNTGTPIVNTSNGTPSINDIYLGHGTLEEFEAMDNDQKVEIMEEVAKEKETGNTIQFSLNPDEKYPVYHDTGVKVYEGNVINPYTAIDVIRAIVIKSEGTYIEDTDRVLAVINGRVIVVNTTDLIKVDDFLKLFENDKFAVKVQKSRTGGRYGAVEYLEINGQVSIKTNTGEVISLTVDPVIEDSNLLLPIRDIGVALGAKVKYDKPQRRAELLKDGKTIVVVAGKEEVIINGKTAFLGAEAKLNTEERIVAIMDLIVSELKGKLEWDANEKAIIVSKL